MKTVHEVSALTGVSVRTLHHYDAVGLLRPTQTTEAGYRLYDDAALLRLQTILLFRELQFSLGEIRAILDSPGFDRKKALHQQITLMELQRERLGNMIFFARQIQRTGVENMDFSAFDKSKIDKYTAEAKALWGKTDAYREFETKTEGQTEEQRVQTGDQLMGVFAAMGKLRETPPEGAQAQAKVEELRQFITAHYYNCTPQILAGLGQMYCAGGSMTENIDRAGGEGTAAFAAKAIEIYCGKKMAGR